MNTTTDLLKGEAWQLLLSRIGDTLMLFLLMHTSLFLPLPNGCFLQVTGASIAEVNLLLSKPYNMICTVQLLTFILRKASPKRVTQVRSACAAGCKSQASRCAPLAICTVRSTKGVSCGGTWFSCHTGRRPNRLRQPSVGPGRQLASTGYATTGQC